MALREAALNRLGISITIKTTEHTKQKLRFEVGGLLGDKKTR